ncbi:MAG: putative MFS family arabinose efflux permease [Kiritimatiellia bacterium]|jgi:predicted MFS family arabinose efflux permease
MPFSIPYLSSLSLDIRQYLLITANYWVFTLSDGALRMLVILHFHHLGYSPLEIAFLFLFYELFGVITNLLGGWLGAKIGLNKTMNIGLGLQIIALSMLLVPPAWLTIPWVMAAQALSGVAKDLNKMSAKSAIKLLVADDAQHTLYRWVALLTGSKNALKGTGFFIGGILLVAIGFTSTIASMAILLGLLWVVSLITLKHDLGKASNKPKFTQIFSKNSAINFLSAARCFLFAARDVWFVVALPVYFSTQLNWSHWQVSSFLALWIIGYGLVQTLAPILSSRQSNTAPKSKSASTWAFPLAIIPLSMAFFLGTSANTTLVLVIGLLGFGVLFAINSSLHSYLILSLAERKNVSLDVGFYYMANALGRLLGTVLSGYLYQAYGLSACLIVSSVFIFIAAILSLFIDTASTKTST